MTGITLGPGDDMATGLPRRIQAVVACRTIPGRRDGMTERRHSPARRAVADIALLVGSDMGICLARRVDAVVTACAGLSLHLFVIKVRYRPTSESMA